MGYLSAECMFCLKIFDLPCEQRYFVDQNENLLFKSHLQKDAYQEFQSFFKHFNKL